MKLNSSIIISTTTLIFSFIFPIAIWLPLSVVAASFISLKVSAWVNSDRLGSSASMSMLLKFICSSIMFYAAIGQYICIFVVVKVLLNK